jgi:chromosome segregation ATPase
VHELGGQLGELTAKHDDVLAAKHQQYLDHEKTKLELNKLKTHHEKELVRLESELSLASSSATRKSATLEAESDRSVAQSLQHNQQLADARLELESALQESLDVTKAKTSLENEVSALKSHVEILTADSEDRALEIIKIRREKTETAEHLTKAREEVHRTKMLLIGKDGGESLPQTDQLRGELASQAAAHATEMDEVITITKGLRSDLEAAERTASKLRAEKRASASAADPTGLQVQLAAAEQKHADAIDTIIVLQEQRDALEEAASNGTVKVSEDRAAAAEAKAAALQAELDISKLSRSGTEVTSDEKKAHNDKRYDEAIDTIIALQDSVAAAQGRIKELEAASEASGAGGGGDGGVAAAAVAAAADAKLRATETELAETKLAVSAATVVAVEKDEEVAALEAAAAGAAAKVSELEAALVVARKNSVGSTEALDMVITLQDAATKDAAKITELELLLVGAAATATATSDGASADVNAELMATIRTLQDQGKAQRANYSELAAQMSATEPATAALKEEVAVLKQRNADAIEKIVALQDEADGDLSADEDASEALVATQQQLQDAMDTITVIMEERDNAQEHVVALEGELDAAMGAGAADELGGAGGAQLEVSTVKAEARILKVKLDASEAAAAASAAELASTSQQLTDAIDAVSSIMGERDDAAERAAALESEVAALHANNGGGSGSGAAEAAAAATAAAERESALAAARAAARRAQQEERAAAAEAAAEEQRVVAAELLAAAEEAEAVDAAPSSTAAPPVKLRTKKTVVADPAAVGVQRRTKEKRPSLVALGLASNQPGSVTATEEAKAPATELQKSFNRLSRRGPNPFAGKTAAPGPKSPQHAPVLDTAGKSAHDRTAMWESQMVTSPGGTAQEAAPSPFKRGGTFRVGLGLLAWCEGAGRPCFEGGGVCSGIGVACV